MAGDTTSDAPEPGVRTFRGRSVDAILPRVRAELGAEAIVLRRREGLSGGIAGFFQRSYAEVDARAPLPDELRVGRDDAALRNDRATAEGLASPAIQALVEQAAPFAAALARATDAPSTATSGRAHDILLAAARGASTPEPESETEPVAAGLYGPQPNTAALEAALVVAPPAPARRDPSPAAPVASPARPAAAETAVKRLVAAGLSQSLADDVVAEALVHGVPFAGPGSLKKLVRTALARRMPVMADLGGDPRTLAFVGGAGAGKSTAVATLATAYAEADARVTVVALRAADGGRALSARLEPLGVTVIAAADAAQAERRLAHSDATLTLIDTPAAGPGDRTAVAALATDLRALGVQEVHLTLPATLSAAAGDELAAAVAPLGITHVALTHSDQTARPGAPVELAVTGRRALSYACTRDAIEPADPADLARRLLP
jgi:flagellar biosynthesis GTPase FlhF